MYEIRVRHRRCYDLSQDKIVSKRSIFDVDRYIASLPPNMKAVVYCHEPKRRAFGKMHYRGKRVRMVKEIVT